MPNHKKIGLVLGGGGAKGLAHIGVLSALEEAEIKPGFIVGVSMGAAVGAAYASGLSPAMIAAEAEKRGARLNPFKYLDIGKLSKSVIKGQKLADYLKKLYNDMEFNDLAVPLHVLATDLEAGKEVMINEGKLADAVMASITVPGIFPPVKKDGRLLVDGGVVNPTPIDRARKLGADIVIAVDLIMRRKTELKDPGVVKILMQSYEIIRTQMIKLRAEQKADDLILIQPDTGGTVDSFRFNNVKSFTKAGHQATMDKIKDIKNKL